jgi:uncharacterized membrane protein
MGWHTIAGVIMVGALAGWCGWLLIHRNED